MMTSLYAKLLAVAALTVSPTMWAQTAGSAAAGGDKAQQSASRTFAAKAQKVKAAAMTPTKAAALTPLNPRERVVQLLDRFTFGPRPGEVDRVMAMGADKWLDQQFNPQGITDTTWQKKQNDYSTLVDSPQQALMLFPDRGQIEAVEKGKVSYPTDPLLKSVYEVQIYKLQQEEAKRKSDADTVAKGQTPQDPTAAEKAEKKKADEAKAMHVAGELLALPKGQRISALLAMPVEDRVAFTGDGNLMGDQRNALLADFSPHEREFFNAMASNLYGIYHIGEELAQGRMLRDILSERQLQAVMTNFWFNHFNVYVEKDSDGLFTNSYERDVITKNALGSFRALLIATAQSQAMQIYLDNWESIGPDSLANGVDPRNPKAKKGNRGLNENYGREVMELHTVGVNGGYTQADVTALSAILTGWTVNDPGKAGPFEFDYKRHEPGPKRWFGYEIAENGQVTKLPAGTNTSAPTFGPSNTVATPDSMKQGLAALNILADSPQTAHFISYLLAQYFVADNPPPALVDRLQKTFLTSHGDIKTILRALIASPEFNSKQYYRNKVKTPEEFVASAFRATATDPSNPNALVYTVRNMGMPLYNAVPPTGYYLTADQWMNSSALVARLNFAYQLTMGKFANQKFDAPKLLAMGLLMPNATAHGDDTGKAEARPVGEYGAGASSGAKLVGVAAKVAEPTPMPPSTRGQQVALHVLESTIIGGPVSAHTNQLIEKQMQQQPETAAPVDTLNLLTALVLGSPEFQVR
jgi:uncharacterized protein (DUF1800 family)